MKRGVLAFVLATAAGAGTTAAQSTQAELAITAGASTQSVSAVGTQIRLFGEAKRHLRYFLEAAWATESGTESDAFGAAYPYDQHVRAIETYGEAFVQREKLLLSVRAGRYRTPFGIYGRSDHAYTGFTRPPLIRYDDYFGLSNNFLEGGVNVLAGTPMLHAEVSLGVPQDEGQAVRQSGLDPVFRIEGYAGGLIVGASHMRSRPYDRRFFVHGDLVFTGLDFRYMLAGVQLRGEWVTGRPFDNVVTRGWYLDAIVHRPEMGPVTLVARAEKLDYVAGLRSRYDNRFTTGALVRLPGDLVAQVNVSHQPGGYFGDTQRTAVDALLTWAIRYPR